MSGHHAHVLERRAGRKEATRGDCRFGFLKINFILERFYVHRITVKRMHIAVSPRPVRAVGQCGTFTTADEPGLRRR